MHIHILGICGTFMGGIAVIARQAGHEVTGCDSSVYPPMSTQLRDLGIDVHEGFDAAQLDVRPDCVVVGNVMSRGVDVVEAPLPEGAQIGEQRRAQRCVHVRCRRPLLEDFHEFFVSAEPGEDFAEGIPDEIVLGVEFEREREVLIGAVRIAEFRIERREFE